MIETILYQFTKIAGMLGSFLIAITLIGMILYLLIRKLTMKDMKIKLYGLFLNLRNIDMIALSAIICRTFILIYCACTNANQNIILSIMIALVTQIMCLYNMKRVIWEWSNLIAQIFAIYLIHIIYQYQLEVENTIYVEIVKNGLIVFICIYAIYTFLIGLEEIVKKNKNVRRNWNEEN